MAQQTRTGDGAPDRPAAGDLMPDLPPAAASPSRTVRRPARLGRLLSYDDFRSGARRALPRPVFDYLDGAAGDEVTAARNVQAFSEVVLRPSVGRWVTPDLSTTVCGTRLSLPVLTAPCGGMRVVHPDGDLGIARAASRVGGLHVASSASGYTLEEIAAAAGGPRWFQLYNMGGRPMMEQMLDRVGAAGYEALVLTLDTPVNGNRDRDVRNGFTLTTAVNARTAITMAPFLLPRPRWVTRFVRDGLPFGLANTRGPDGRPLPLAAVARPGTYANCPTWGDVAWIRERWSGPILIKGLVTPEDARRAVDAGAQGVIVSNHGGRQLDGAPATATVLPSVVAAVGDLVDVLVDSGVRRGTDVVKALALGAKAVLVGRMPAFGLAVAGETGVDRVLELLREDLVRAMRLMGCSAVSDLGPDWLIGPRSEFPGGT